MAMKSVVFEPSDDVVHILCYVWEHCVVQSNNDISEILVYVVQVLLID